MQPLLVKSRVGLAARSRWFDRAAVCYEHVQSARGRCVATAAGTSYFSATDSRLQHEYSLLVWHPSRLLATCAVWRAHKSACKKRSIRGRTHGTARLAAVIQCAGAAVLLVVRKRPSRVWALNAPFDVPATT